MQSARMEGRIPHFVSPRGRRYGSGRLLQAAPPARIPAAALRRSRARKRSVFALQLARHARLPQRGSVGTARCFPHSSRCRSAALPFTSRHRRLLPARGSAGAPTAGQLGPQRRTQTRKHLRLLGPSAGTAALSAAARTGRARCRVPGAMSSVPGAAREHNAAIRGWSCSGEAPFTFLMWHGYQ